MGPSFSAFTEELTKIAGMRDIWRGLLDLFRTDKERVQRRVDYHFSPKAGPDKWAKLLRNTQDPKFIEALKAHSEADPKLVLHTQSLHDLSQGKVLGKVRSERLPGRTYEIRTVPAGMGCTCGDWRYVGTVNPGYECKHIRAYKEGKTRVS